MVNQAIVGTEKNLPHGTEEGVPARLTGKEEGHPTSPMDDKNTEKRRAHYGSDPAFEIKSGEDMPEAVFDVNQVKTPNNPTMVDQIRGSNSDKNPETSYGRHSCQ